MLPKNPNGGGYNLIPICTLEEVDKSVLIDSIVIIAMYNPLANDKIYESLRNLGCKNVYKYSDGIGNFCCNDNFDKKECIRCVFIESCNRFKKYCAGYDYEKLNVINDISISVTNRCVLNCKGCAACTDHIRKTGIHYDLCLESLRKYMDLILKEVDYINRVDLTGGECLLCKELNQILEYLCNRKEIGYIKLLTTATLTISDELLNILANNNIMVCIDDYGNHLPDKLQKKVKENMELLEKSGVYFQRINNEIGTWYNFGGFEQRNDKVKAVENNKICYLRKCLFLSPNGILSWCTRNVAAIDYNMIPDFKDEYCDLEKEGVEKIRKVLSLEYLHACEYCNGSHEENIIESGVQITGE